MSTPTVDEASAPPWIDASEAARLLGVGRRVVEQLKRQGRFVTRPGLPTSRQFLRESVVALALNSIDLGENANA